MYNQQLHLHFIGIGGVGMAGIAEVLINLGYPISGSDIKDSHLVNHLRELGAKISIGHNKNNIPAGTSVIVTSSAVDHTNAEVIEAIERGIPIIPRAEMLSELMRMKYGIAVAGSHGKTSTTSMIGKILNDVGYDPTIIVGGRILSQNSGAKLGTGQYLVAESDESDGSFNLLRPAIAIVTNIDNEHMSHYGSFGNLENSFKKFIQSVPFYGIIVACYDDPVVRGICQDSKRRVFSYGLSPEWNLHAENIVIDKGVSKFNLVFDNKSYDAMIPVPGQHMVLNALASISVALELGVYIEEAINSLSTFAGVARRSQLLIEKNGITILDDYGHHPTEIRSTIKAIKESYIKNNSGTLKVIFQPHRFSRTRELFGDFVNCFEDADELFVSDIYSAGEEAITGITGESLANSIHNKQTKFIGNLLEDSVSILNQSKSGDVILTLGAGSITQIGHELAKILNEKPNC